MAKLQLKFCDFVILIEVLMTDFVSEKRVRFTLDNFSRIKTCNFFYNFEIQCQISFYQKSRFLKI